MNVAGKTHIFLPVHPKCKSLKPEVLSVRSSFRELSLESSTTSALTPGGDARELGEGGLTQIAGDVKEQRRAPEKVFSRIILHFEAASYSVCDEQETSSEISINYLCIEPSCQQQRRHLPGGLPTMQEKLFLGVKTSLFPLLLEERGTQHPPPRPVFFCV